MKNRYIRNQGVHLLLWLCCAQGMEQEVEPRRDSLKQLESKIMSSWNQVNIARAISPQSVEPFCQRIIVAYSELYLALCSALSRENFSSHELVPLHRILKGLCISHDAWCSEQNTEITIGAYCLMIAIIHIWRFVLKAPLSTNMEHMVDVLDYGKSVELKS